MLHALVVSLAVQTQTAASAPIAEVTVFPGSALVRRHAELANGAGKVRFADLPASFDANTLRVRASGAEVIGIETRERMQARAPDARVEDLRQRQRELQREAQGLEDELATLKQVQAHLEHTSELPGDDAKQAAQVSLDGWSKSVAFFGAALSKNLASQRDVHARGEALQTRIDDLTRQLGAADPQNGVRVREVIVELAGTNAPASLDLEYVVPDAGWTPEYDLRTRSDARAVELGYRAAVWQTSGEDWNEVELSLSTARPHLGAQGPDPQPIWLRVTEPVQERRAARASKDGADSEDFFLGQGVAARDEEASFATAESQGLSVRFRLPRHESVPSRRETTNVLVGEANLDVAPEYVCTPELDAHVWLRGKATNTSPWMLLPGSASVYFGADFLGRSQLALVPPGAEIVLHLGPDPALTVERVTLEDVTSGPGVFSSRAAHKETHRIRLKNSGAAVARADGSAQVFVRERLPKATDERIKVELVDPTFEPLGDERWKKDRDEKGVVTWALKVPRGGETALQFTQRVTYPDSATLHAR